MIWIGEMYHEARNEAKQHENMKICLQDDNERLRAQLAAARNEALEEAAKLADSYEIYPTADCVQRAESVTAAVIAADIRAIKQEEQSDE